MLRVAVVVLLAAAVFSFDVTDEQERQPVRKDYSKGVWKDLELGKKQFCAIRPVQQCCPGRDDKCTMPIEDTLCYCDMFCERDSPDCCPDFVPNCLDCPTCLTQKNTTTEEIKNNCYHEGRLHSPGDEIIVNCNNCTCVDAVVKREFNWKCTQKTCLIRHELLLYVNNQTARHGWVAKNYSNFWGLSLQEGIKYRLGTRKPTSHVTEMNELQQLDAEEIPETFDSRTEWPGLISPVLDQGNCGSSWAFSTTGVASDRLRIHSNGVHVDTLSPQHLISCNIGQHGCGSGHVDRAWWFMRKHGIVTLQCLPYTSGKTKTANTCPLPRAYGELKKSTCPASGTKMKVYQASPPYKIAPNEKQIMNEILNNGPVQVVMEVKEDFFMYKSGVYRHSLPADYLSANQRQTNFHSVRLIGWGTDTVSGKPLKYWLCANSWGTEWGEDGYFRIQRGTNESGIESSVVGVWIKANERMLVKKRRHQHAKEPEEPGHHNKIRHHKDSK